MSWDQIGTVEILRDRVYRIDPQNEGILATSVVVEPGVYPVYRNFDAICWIMRGRLNENFGKIGDGMFLLSGGDVPSELEVQFPSKTFGLQEFHEFLTDPVATPGPDQRLVFQLTESWAS